MVKFTTPRSTATKLVQLEILREEVQTGSIERVLLLLNHLSSTRELAWANRCTLAIQVSGYNDDPRDLWEIPEVCAFFRALHAKWRYWFFFTTTEVNTLQVLENCIVGVTQISPGHQVMRSTARGKHFLECCVAMNELFQKYSFPDAENDRMGTGIMEVLKPRK